MRNLFTICLLSLCFTASAQIPDSFDMVLPWSTIEIQSCESPSGQEPESPHDWIDVSTPAETFITDDNGNCIKVARLWTVLNWHDGETYAYAQVCNINNSLEANNITVEEDYAIVISIESVVDNPEPSDVLSFDMFDPDVKWMEVFVSDAINGMVQVPIYNHATNAVVFSDITFLECTYTVEVPSDITVEFGQESYVLLNENRLGLNIDYPCGTYDIKYNGSYNEPFISYTQIGTTEDYELEVILENHPNEVFMVSVYFGGEAPTPIPMYIEDINFEAGDIIELDVWGEGLEDLAAWQMQLQLQDARFLELQEGVFDYAPSNIFDDGYSLRSLWTPANGLSVDVESNATWFTLKIETEIAGSTQDILITELDPWSEIFLEEETTYEQYPVLFNFNIEERNFLVTSSSDNAPEDFIIYPNPAHDMVELRNNQNDPVNHVNVLNTNGQKVLQYDCLSDADCQFNVQMLTAGLYILDIRTNKNHFAKKLLISK